jgi:hypothetical protein
MGWFPRSSEQVQFSPFVVIFLRGDTLYSAVANMKDYLTVLSNATSKFSGGVTLTLTAVPNIFDPSEEGSDVIVFGYVILC